nr:Rha family transcriptional regulator [Bacillus subtilis]
MNQLVFIEGDQVVTDSLTVAEVFGKRHDTVLRDIRNLDSSKEFNSRTISQLCTELYGIRKINACSRTGKACL